MSVDYLKNKMHTREMQIFHSRMKDIFILLNIQKKDLLLLQHGFIHYLRNLMLIKLLII